MVYVVIGSLDFHHLCYALLYTHRVCRPERYAQFFFWRRNLTKTLGFLLLWISPWFFVGFLLSPPPHAQSFLRKPSVLVLADFFPWFSKSKQLLGFLELFTC